MQILRGYVSDLPSFYQLKLILITLDRTNLCRDLAASINPSSFSTLRSLYFCLVVDVRGYIHDPLSGICDEFAAISGHNAIEELDLEIEVCYDSQNPDHWGGRLDDVLATGFPKLGRVSLHVSINTSIYGDSTFVDRVKKLQSSWLSKNSIVKFTFSLDLQYHIDEYYVHYFW